MFSSVGRRLALLNAAVVVGVIALVTLASHAVVRQTLTREVDSELQERAVAVAEVWARELSDRLGGSVPAPTVGTVDGDDRHHLGNELLEGGDTLVYVFGASGQMLYSAHNATFSALPDQEGLAEALRGAPNLRDVTVSEEAVRVLSTPVYVDGRLVGVVQVARGKQQVSDQLRSVLLANLATTGLGVLVAVPAGLFLARRAMQPISDAFARQRAFVADASHELRTPLAVIRANVELVQRLLPRGSEPREELGSVVEEVDQMARQVDDLLFLARTDAGEVTRQRERVDLSAIAEAAAAPMRPIADRAGVALTVDTGGSLPVVADEEQVRRVVRNLVDNAIRYTPAGGSVAVRSGLTDGRPTVRVRDTGTGIAPADQAKVFERFYRTDAARSRQTGGTGLGLAIAKAIVTAHGGRIGLASTPGKGTEVWFSLPPAPAATLPTAPPATRPASAAGTPPR